MKTRLCFALAWLALPSLALSADRVKLREGSPVAGKITSITATEVSFEQGSSKKTIPVNQVLTITFDSEPKELTNARTAVEAMRYDDALTLLDKVKADEISREEIKQDVAFYKAIAQARLALMGNDAEKKNQAYGALLEVQKSGNNHHSYEVAESLGEMLVAAEKVDAAKGQYAKIAAAPWPEYKMHAGVLMGRALEKTKQFAKAGQLYDRVIATSATGKAADAERLAATLGKASALAGEGKSDEGIKLVEEVIAKADADNKQLHAWAYNVLGKCYLASQKNKEALLAFLHVDILYSNFPDQHAEALAHLADLWITVDKSDRATQARQQLQERYPNSSWAKR